MRVMIPIIIFILLILSAPVGAEVIMLKSGGAINAEIMEKDDQKIKTDVNGVSLTYYLDDIESIDGKDPVEFLKSNLSVPAAQPVSPVAPQVKPQAKPVSDAKSRQSAALSGTDKKTLILQFIDAFGTRSSLEQNFEELAKRVPAQQLEEFKKALDVDQLIEQLTPLYDKHFTADELQAYIEFYSSPAGKKLVTTIPQVMTESVGVSLNYFKSRIPTNPAQEKK